MYKNYLFLLCITLSVGSGIWTSSCDSDVDPLFEFPDHANPEKIGKMVSEDLLSRDYMIRASDTGIHYAEIITAEAAIRFANFTGNAAMMEKLRDRYSCFIDTAGCAGISPMHIRNNVSMITLSLYEYYEDQFYFDRTVELMQDRWDRWASADPETGLPASPRYWSDDMYFGATLESRIYLITGDESCTRRATKWLSAYVDTLQLPNGLIRHTSKVDFIWGRGDGWAAAGLSNVLLALPPDHPEYQHLMDAYLSLMDGLLPYQTENGLWRQLIDVPEAWEETSGTGMFAFALITGIKKGWLDRDVYGQPMRDAWLGLVDKVNDKGKLEEVCIGTNQKFTAREYLDRPRRAGDFHGQAALLWAVNALLWDPLESPY